MIQLDVSDDEYDRILSNAVRAILNQRNSRQLEKNLNVAIRTVAYVDILMQTNPTRPIVWELAFTLFRRAANPLADV